jgi:hypothetical protein
MDTKPTPEPVSELILVCDTLAADAERLRKAHVLAREYNWPAPIVEDEDTLREAAEKVERFRLGLLRFTRQYLRGLKV